MFIFENKTNAYDSLAVKVLLLARNYNQSLNAVKKKCKAMYSISSCYTSSLESSLLTLGKGQYRQFPYMRDRSGLLWRYLAWWGWPFKAASSINLGTCLINLAKIWVVYQGFCCSWNMGYINVLVKINSISACHCVTQGVPESRVFHSLVTAIRTLMEEDWNDTGGLGRPRFVKI